MDKEIPSHDNDPAEEAMLREEGICEVAPQMTQAEKDAAIATKLWVISRLAWAAKAKGANAQIIRYRLVTAILGQRYTDVEILAELKSKGIPTESARYHLAEYKFEFRKLRKS